MRSLTVRPALFIHAVLASTCEDTPVQRPGTTSASRPVPPSLMEVPPQDMRKALVEGYRLKPDRRFLLAVGEIHSFLSGQKTQEAAVEFKDSGWEIRYANQVVGHVPELPDFPDFDDLLAGWTKRMNEQDPLRLSGNVSDQLPREISSPLEGFFAPEVTAGLREIDLQWRQGHHDAAFLSVATRGFVSLVLQGYDTAEIADRVAGRALALLTLTKNLTTARPAREECLLAEAMGYSTHAVDMAAKLAESDPARLYVLRDDHRLKDAAMAAGSSPESRYFWMVRLAARGDVNAWSAAERSLFQLGRVPFAVTQAGMGFNTFEVWSKLPRLARLAVQQAVVRERGPLTLSKALGDPIRTGPAYLAQLFHTGTGRSAPERFASGLDIAAAKYPGPFLESETFRVYYLASYYSSLQDEGVFYLDSLSSAPDARHFVGELGDAQEGPAADFKVWYSHLAESKAGPSDLNAMLKDMSGLSSLGARPLRRTFHELQERAGYGDPRLLTATRRLAARMDTRVDDRYYMGNLALSGLRDLKLTEKLYGSVVKAAASRHPSLQAWNASFMGDTNQLMHLVHSPRHTLRERGEALEYLENKKGTSPETIRKEYAQLIKEAPDSWQVRQKYVDYLEKAKDYAGARAVLEPWLESNKGSDDLAYAAVQTTLARQYYLEGRYSEAWDAVEPAIESWQGGAMQRGALTLNKLGFKEEAEKLARQAVDRYPGGLHLRAMLAGFYREWGRPKDAAVVLKSGPHALSITDWQQHFAPKFAEVFKDRPRVEALAAFETLVAQGIGPFELEPVTDAMANARKDDLAFQMVSRLHFGGIGDLTFRIDGYKYLKAVKGPKAALEWVRTAIQPNLYNPTTMMAFTAHEYGLLWDLVDKPTPGYGEDFAWAMRAAASVKLGPRKDSHRVELEKYFQQHTKGYWETIGRYLMGLASEDELVAQAKNPRERCENAYYLGLRAESDDRFEDASDWYRISVESGLENMGEYRWAYNTLYLWEGKGMSLARIAAEARGAKGK